MSHLLVAPQSPSPAVLELQFEESQGSGNVYPIIRSQVAVDMTLPAVGSWVDWFFDDYEGISTPHLITSLTVRSNMLFAYIVTGERLPNLTTLDLSDIGPWLTFVFLGNGWQDKPFAALETLILPPELAMKHDPEYWGIPTIHVAAPLSTESVDAILQAAVDGQEGEGYIDLLGVNAPSAAGFANIAVLEARDPGWFIFIENHHLTEPPE